MTTNSYPVPTRDPFTATDPTPFPVVRESRAEHARHIVTTDVGDIFFTGQLIGQSTSWKADHLHGGDVKHAAPRARCFTCRWMEAKIYLVESIVTNIKDKRGVLMTTYIEPEGRYLVCTVGGTIVPGEKTYRRAVFTNSGFEVIELLTIRKADKPPYMSAISARALSQAAHRDEDIGDAFVNRAVV